MARPLNLWILNGRTPEPCHDIAEWSLWMATHDPQVARTELHRPRAPPVLISTVFLGISSSLNGYGPPAVFETMAFIANKPSGQWRWATWEEAEAGHKAVIDSLRVSASAPSRSSH